MAELLLVRHGQASFGKANYDELSELGHEQARITGKWLHKIVKPTQWVSGALNRQQQTLQGVIQGYENLSEGSLQLDLETTAAFDEFNHQQVIAVAFPEFADRVTFAKHITNSPDPKKYFHRLYQQAVAKWIAADGEYDESFREFVNRVEGGLDKILATTEAGESIVLVSSAGAICIALTRIMGVDYQQALLHSEVMANGAISRVLFNGHGQRSLSYFNNFQHLNMADVKVTYR